MVLSPFSHGTGVGGRELRRGPRALSARTGGTSVAGVLSGKGERPSRSSNVAARCGAVVAAAISNVSSGLRRVRPDGHTRGARAVAVGRQAPEALRARGRHQHARLAVGRRARKAHLRRCHQGALERACRFSRAFRDIFR